MMKNGEEIKRLTFENYIWGVYIVIAICNIYGDELIKKSIKENDRVSNKKAMIIFKAILISSLIIYLYFLKRNYNDLKILKKLYKDNDLKKNNYDSKYMIRLIGSILVFVGTICFLYFQDSISVETDSLSNV